MSTEERLEALYKLLGPCMSRDPHVRAIARVHVARSDFDLLACLAEMVRCLATEKERLAMDLTTAKINQIEAQRGACLGGKGPHSDQMPVAIRFDRMEWR